MSRTEDIVFDVEDLVLDIEDDILGPRHQERGPRCRGRRGPDVEDQVLSVGNVVDKVLQPDEVHRIAYVREVVHIVNLVPGVLIVGAHVLAVVVLEYFDLETRGPRLQ